MQEMLKKIWQRQLEDPNPSQQSNVLKYVILLGISLSHGQKES